jgi:hypothetical protein
LDTVITVVSGWQLPWALPEQFEGLDELLKRSEYAGVSLIVGIAGGRVYTSQ